MATLHRSRVVAVGSEADMLKLCRVLLEHADWYEETEERKPYTLDELYAEVQKQADWEEAGSSFLYSMIAPNAYGSAEAGTAKFELCKFEENLWAAMFTYDSMDLWQAEDWIVLHKRCGRIPMFCIHADENFALAKGYLIISNGKARETWTMMAESWLWLFDQYEAGYPKEEICPRLKRLERMMAEEEWDQTVEELLDACAENLTMIREYPPVTLATLKERIAEKDFMGAFEMQAQLADTLLWDSARSAKYLACIESAATAWKENG